MDAFRVGVDIADNSDYAKASCASACPALVVELLPKAMYRVKCRETGRVMLASAASSLRRVCLKIIPGDRVMVQPSPYDPNQGRITSRIL